MRYLLLAPLFFLLACGSEDSDIDQELFYIDSPTELSDLPWDVTQEDAPTPPDGGVGANKEAFTISLYYGQDLNKAGIPCYSNPDNVDCEFPIYKAFRVTVSYAACDNGSILGVSSADCHAILDSYEAGVELWNGQGGVIVNKSVAANVIPVVIEPVGGFPEFWASTTYPGVLHRQVADLPKQTVGNDRKAAYQYSAVLMDVAVAKVRNSCSAQLSTFSKEIGHHEGGHMAGFGHFAAPGNIMYPRSSCSQPARGADSLFATALSRYNGSASGLSVVNDSLNARIPCDTETHCTQLP